MSGKGKPQGSLATSNVFDARQLAEIREGVLVPHGKYYRMGDTLSRVASMHRTTTTHLKRALAGVGEYRGVRCEVPPVVLLSPVYAAAQGSWATERERAEIAAAYHEEEAKRTHRNDPTPLEDEERAEVPLDNPEYMEVLREAQEESITEGGTQAMPETTRRMKRKERVTPTDTEALYGRWLVVKEKLPQKDVAARMNWSENLLSDVVHARGKYTWMARVPVTEHDPRYEDPYTLTPPIPPAQMGNLGEALVGAGVTPQSVSHHHQLPVDARRWYVGRDIQNSQYAHLWRLDPAKGVIKTPCGIHLQPKEAVRLTENKRPPWCRHCQRYFDGIKSLDTRQGSGSNGYHALPPMKTPDETLEAAEPLVGAMETVAAAAPPVPQDDSDPVYNVLQHSAHDAMVRAVIQLVGGDLSQWGYLPAAQADAIRDQMKQVCDAVELAYAETEQLKHLLGLG